MSRFQTTWYERFRKDGRVVILARSIWDGSGTEYIAFVEKGGEESGEWKEVYTNKRRAVAQARLEAAKRGLAFNLSKDYYANDMKYVLGNGDEFHF